MKNNPFIYVCTLPLAKYLCLAGVFCLFMDNHQGMIKNSLGVLIFKKE